MPYPFDLIVPCFNPRSGWEKTLADAVTEIESSLGENTLKEVILIDDGSAAGFTKDSETILLHLNSRIRIIRSVGNHGKGHAVRLGLLSSASPIQIYTDVDFPYLNLHVVDFYNRLANDEADIIVASRGASYYDSLSPFRRWLSHSMRTVNRIAFGLRVSDTQGGLKGMNSRGRQVFLTTTINRYLFDLEFIQKASKQGLRILPIEVELKKGILLPSPKLGILMREVGNLLRLLFRL
jgi:glycosyltransferase involved in cell wall biosynthesis